MAEAAMSAGGAVGAAGVPGWRKAAAWGVHLYTASGLVLALVAVLAIFRGEWRTALVCMALSFVVDGTDGVLARAVRVREAVPGIDGKALDNVVDFTNHVFVPAVLLARAGLLPPAWATPAAAVVLLMAAFHWANANSVTEDEYISGFPGNWNVVIGYLFLLRPPPWAVAAVIVFVGVLTVVPLKFVYVTHTREWLRVTVVMSALWGVAWLLILLRYPHTERWLIWASLLYIVYLVALGTVRTFRGAPAAAKGSAAAGG